MTHTLQEDNRNSKALSALIVLPDFDNDIAREEHQNRRPATQCPPKSAPAWSAFPLPSRLPAANIKARKAQRDTIAEIAENMLEDFPASEVADRVCRRATILTAAQIPLSIGDGSDFAYSGNLAAYAAITPVTRKIRLINTRRIPRPSRKQAAEKRPVLLTLSPPYTVTTPHVSTTNANAQKENATMPQSYVWHDDGATSSSR